MVLPLPNSPGALSSPFPSEYSIENKQESKENMIKQKQMNQNRTKQTNGRRKRTQAYRRRNTHVHYT